MRDLGRLGHAMKDSVIFVGRDRRELMRRGTNTIRSSALLHRDCGSHALLAGMRRNILSGRVEAKTPNQETCSQVSGDPCLEVPGREGGPPAKLRPLLPA